jgi:glycine/sarcosine N-methyltransferase
METLDSREFYDRLAESFDLMTDWAVRLAHEMPFIQRTLEEHKARSILDAACGTGWHAITLAQRGYAATGCDASAAMVERARENAARAYVQVSFEVADFHHLDKFPGQFDAVLCLGNSLPHLLSQGDLEDAVGQMRRRLHSGGVLILHNLNYDMRLEKKPRFFSANGSADTLVWRFADYGPEFITFHTALFRRTPPAGAEKSAFWTVQVNSTLQRPLRERDLDEALPRAGFGNIRHFGGLDGSSFDRGKSGDLVILATAG